MVNRGRMHGHGINFHKIIINSLGLENRKNQIQKKLTACFFSSGISSVAGIEISNLFLDLPLRPKGGIKH
jgi:hypothetical protein